MEKRIKILERSVRERKADFSGLYMSLVELRGFMEKRPEAASSETVVLLEKILEAAGHSARKQALFLYREAAGALAFMASRNRGKESVAPQALGALRRILLAASGPAHRAAAEALGALPLDICGPHVDGEGEVSRLGSSSMIPQVSWREVGRHGGAALCSAPVAMGRSLVLPGRRFGEILVIKRAAKGQALGRLQTEIAWMNWLRRHWPGRGHFRVPKPLKLFQSGVFRLRADGDDRGCFNDGKLHPERYAVAFLAPSDYFVYINEPANGAALDAATFEKVLIRNARLLGELTGEGILHTAPVPLFHNRVQRDRRNDGGRYQWPRGGRLDRWLESCRYPNFGLTGIRDFEHFISWRNGERGLYEHLGSHLLSLLLVAASYFRNQRPERVGLDSKGEAVDARELFDEGLLTKLVSGIFRSYYAGFTGAELNGKLPFDAEFLASRMIDEMGVDRHMEEVLRAVDQQAMDDETFQSFLMDRGCSIEEIAGFSKGARDIAIATGPHLGGFNDRISLPELVELLATASALCVADRFKAARDF